MKGIFAYLGRVINDKNNIFFEEKRHLKDSVIFFILLLFCLALLVSPLGREIIKWMGYISVSCLFIFSLCACLSSIFNFFRSFRYAKKLEKLGSSPEREEMARRALCELEGDDGLPPASDIKW